MINETLSDRLDILTGIEKTKEEKEYKKYQEYCKKVEKLVEKHFKKAQKTLGYRFSYKKQHESMFYFYFNMRMHNSSHTATFYITFDSFRSYTDLKALKVKVTPYDTVCCRFNRLIGSIEREILLIELSDKVIEYINYYVNSFIGDIKE